MRKTLQDVALYLKEILVPSTLEIYDISPEFSSLAGEENIHIGISEFREFLIRLYDELYIKWELYDTSKKVAHEYENRTTLSVYYPFLNHVKELLMNIGYQGKLDKTDNSIVCRNSVFNEKLSASKTLECLRFLSQCGVCFEGVDLNEKKIKVSDIDSLKVTYPHSPNMLIGMKAMATLEIEHGTLVNQDIFLRCDYRLLHNKTDAISVLNDTIIPLPESIQEFILEAHHRYTDKGLSPMVEIKGFHIYIKYCYKRKDVWGFNASLNNGYHINVKSTKTDEYSNTISDFSPVLQELIDKGYGCGRKREIGHCDGGCRGIPIMMDESVLDIRDEIITWFDQELMCLSKK